MSIIEFLDFRARCATGPNADVTIRIYAKFNGPGVYSLNLQTEKNGEPFGASFELTKSSDLGWVAELMEMMKTAFSLSGFEMLEAFPLTFDQDKEQ